MPRPKVPLSQRQRAVGACNFCRSSKKRCSGTVPCAACVRRGRSDSCFLPHSHRRPRDTTTATYPGSSPEIRRHITQDKQDSAQPVFLSETNRMGGGSSQPEDHRPMQYLTPEAHINADENSPQAQASETTPLEAPELQYEPRSRMLRNLRGERGTLSLPMLLLVSPFLELGAS